jgi:hypothetical protein
MHHYLIHVIISLTTKDIAIERQELRLRLNFDKPSLPCSKKSKLPVSLPILLWYFSCIERAKNKTNKKKKQVCTDWALRLSHFPLSLLYLFSLRKIGVHWVRCLRPNKEKYNRKFDEEFVLHQMRCVGMAQTVSMRKCGFSGRMLFTYFVEKYKVSNKYNELNSILGIWNVECLISNC